VKVGLLLPPSDDDGAAAPEWPRMRELAINAYAAPGIAHVQLDVQPPRRPRSRPSSTGWLDTAPMRNPSRTVS
jgi:hypothetical protein